MDPFRFDDLDGWEQVLRRLAGLRDAAKAGRRGLRWSLRRLQPRWRDRRGLPASRHAHGVLDSAQRDTMRAIWVLHGSSGRSPLR